jgi:hypothetical protein
MASKLSFGIERLIFYPEFIGLIAIPGLFRKMLSISKYMLNSFVQILFTDFLIRNPTLEMIKLLMQVITNVSFVDHSQPMQIGDFSQVCLYKILSMHAITFQNMKSFSAIVQKVIDPIHANGYGYFSKDKTIFKIKEATFNNNNSLIDAVFNRAKKFIDVVFEKYELSLFELHLIMGVTYRRNFISIIEYMGISYNIQNSNYNLYQFENYEFWQKLNLDIDNNIFFKKLLLSSNKQFLFNYMLHTYAPLIVEINDVFIFNKRVICCYIIFKLLLLKYGPSFYLKLATCFLSKYENINIPLLLIDSDTISKTITPATSTASSASINEFKDKLFDKLVKYFGTLFVNRKTNYKFYYLIGSQIINALKGDQLLAGRVFQSEYFNKLIQTNFIFHEIYGIHFKNCLPPTIEILVGQYDAFITFKEFTERYSSIEIAPHILTMWVRLCESHANKKYAIVIFGWIMKHNHFCLFDAGGILEAHFMQLIENSIFCEKPVAHRLLFDTITSTRNKEVVDNIGKYIKIAIDNDSSLKHPIEKIHVKNMYGLIKDIEEKDLLQSFINLLKYFHPSIFQSTNKYILNREKNRLLSLEIEF